MIKLYDLLIEISPKRVILYHKNKNDIDYGSIVKSFSYNTGNGNLRVTLND